MAYVPVTETREKRELGPYYPDKLCRSIGVLQQLQTLLGDDATLDDVAQVIRRLQREFGPQTQLENVIQFMVCLSLEKQVIQREYRIRR